MPCNEHALSVCRASYLTTRILWLLGMTFFGLASNVKAGDFDTLIEHLESVSVADTHVYQLKNSQGRNMEFTTRGWHGKKDIQWRFECSSNSCVSRLEVAFTIEEKVWRDRTEPIPPYFTLTGYPSLNTALAVEPTKPYFSKTGSPQ